MPSEYANDLMSRVGLDTTEWKKGVSELNAGIKHIETGFQASAALMDDWGNSSDGLKKRIESLNDKLSLQKQKLDILKRAYEEEVAENGESSKAAEELAKKMYQVKNEIERTSSSIKGYTEKLDNMGTATDKTAEKLKDFASKTKTLSTVAAGGLAAIGAGLVKAGQSADELNTLAKQTGLTTAEIQKFKYASDLIDVNLDDITGALRKMTKNMISTSAEVKGAWETLGVSTTTASGKSKDAVDTFYEVLEALSDVRNETERDQLAMLIFGKSANDLAGIVDDGGKALKELGEEAEAAGLIMSQDAVDGANRFNDVIDQMKAKVTASLGKAFSENAEELIPAMESMADAIVDVVNAIADMPPWTTKAAIGILAISSAISPVLTVGGKMVTLFSKIKKAYQAKTAATKAATAAEGAQAGALTTTGTAAAGASVKVKGFGTTLKTALPIMIAVAAALTAIEYAEDERLSGIDEKYDNLIKKEKKISDEKIKALNSELDAHEEAAAEKISSEEKYYDNKISLLENEQKQLKEALEEEKKLYDKAHKERLSQLEKERDLQLEALKTSTSTATAELQAKIDAIDALTEQEEKAEQERENAKKLEELKEAILNAQSLTERQKAQEEYAAFVAELNRKETLNKREEQKKQLENQITTLEKEAEEKEKKINEEYENAVTLEEQKNEAAQEGFEKRQEYLDGYIETQTEKLNKLKDESISRLQEETEAYSKELQLRIDKEQELINKITERLEKEKEKAKETNIWQDFGLVSTNPDPIIENLPANKYADVIKILEKLPNEEREKLLKSPKALRKYLEEQGITIDSNASGTDFFRGGLTRINEEGGEILNLPRGTQIIPHDVSIAAVKEYARQKAAETQPSITNTYNNSYGPQQRVTQVNIAGRNVATIVEPNVSEIQAIKLNQRRRAGNVYR